VGSYPPCSGLLRRVRGNTYAKLEQVSREPNQSTTRFGRGLLMENLRRADVQVFSARSAVLRGDRVAAGLFLTADEVIQVFDQPRFHFPSGNNRIDEAVFQ
jgi:hypothetical protein